MAGGRFCSADPAANLSFGQPLLWPGFSFYELPISRPIPPVREWDTVQSGREGTTFQDFLTADHSLLFVILNYEPFFLMG
jgi:hypothetical protein